VSAAEQEAVSAAEVVSVAEEVSVAGEAAVATRREAAKAEVLVAAPGPASGSESVPDPESAW
jgi:hypothetical protein